MRRDEEQRAAAEEESDEEPEEGESMEPPLPPDGGYGWVILFASFICNMLVDGVCFTFGLFYLEFLAYYGESRAKTSWVGSVLNGMYLSMGPIVSALANKFGCRSVTIAGSLLATVAYILSTFSSNVTVLILTYGALGGMGFGLMYLPAIVMVGYYFDRRRALATGVAVCGSGIGAFVFAPLCERLIASYGWKGATWVIAGLVLNGVVMGALFRPLEGTMRKPRRAQKRPVSVQQKVAKKETPADSRVSNGKLAPGGDQRDALLRAQPADAPPPVADEVAVRMRSLQNLSVTGRAAAAGGRLAAYARSMSRSADDLPARTGHQHGQHDVQRPMYRKDIFYSGSLARLPEYSSSLSMRHYVRSVTDVRQAAPRDAARSDNAAWRCLYALKAMADTVRTTMDFSLLGDPVFCLYGFSCFLCMTGFFVPFIYLPDFAIIAGIPRDRAAFLISIIGITNTLARVLVGWVSDQAWADCLVISNTALIIGGIATILCPFCLSYALLSGYAIIFGACIAAFVSLRSIIMVDLMGIDKLTNAFGMVTMCQGLSSFIGAPIAGALFDATGDYTYSFYLAGATLTLAGIISLPLRRLAAWQKRRRLSQQKDGAMPVLQFDVIAT